MRRFSICFTEPNDEWLNEQVASKSELINDLVRQTRNQQHKIDWIRMKLDREEKSGFISDSQSDILKQSKDMLDGRV